MHYYWKSHRLPGLTDDVIDVRRRASQSITSPFSQIGGWAIGGAVSRVDPDATAVGEREVGLELNVTAAWLPADGERDPHIAVGPRAATTLLRPSAAASTPTSSPTRSAGVELAYGDRLARLTALKDRDDPTNLFRMNANIVPTAQADGSSPATE